MTTYVNPIGPGLQKGRVDQGVDYNGSGPLYALGSGTIINVYNAGWAKAAGGADPGAFIALKLDQPITVSGVEYSVIYYAEGIDTGVTLNQHVNAGQLIGNANGNGIEVGIGDPASIGAALAHGQSGATQAGQVFDHFLAQLSNDPTAGNTAGLPWAKGLPDWQKQVLQDLSQQGKLSGVPPQMVSWLAQAESGFKGGGIDPTSGDGGFFGLNQNGTYPGGTVTPGLLQSTSAESFGAQAVIAASLFNQLQQKFGGNAVEAANAYVLGPNTDVNTLSNISASTDAKLFAQYLGQTQADVSSALGGVKPGLNLDIPVLTGLGTLIGDVLSGAFWKRIGLFALGGGLVLVGVYLFVSNTDTGQKIEGQASSAASGLALAAA